MRRVCAFACACVLELIGRVWTSLMRRYAALRARVLEEEMIVDGVHYINEAYNNGKRIITEGTALRVSACGAAGLTLRRVRV